MSNFNHFFHPASVGLAFGAATFYLTGNVDASMLIAAGVFSGLIYIVEN